MKHNERPAIGAKMYFVYEHFYKIPGHAEPLTEYCVCEAEVTGFFEGSYVDICLTGKLPSRGMTPHYYPLKGIGEQIFYTPREAAKIAKRMTEKYERTWSWTGDPPMRRTWAHLMEEVTT